ncbi:MAG: signal peptidase I [Clostridia bacterium]|nr:signal peptidase I [Clostridia bacterium]
MDENINIENTAADAENKGVVREIFEWVMCIVIAVAVAMFIKTFIMTVAKVDGESMLDTLHDQERLIAWKLGYEPENNDVIIFQPRESTPQSRKFFVKRVIATENQSVEINYNENAVYVDGVKIDEPYIYEEMLDISFGSTDYWVVPEDHVFVMGDNRNNSRDSRSDSVGFVNCDSIEGKVVFRFWPLNKMGIVK